MDEIFLQNKPYIEDFWDTPLHNVFCQISAPQKSLFAQQASSTAAMKAWLFFWMHEKDTSATHDRAKQLCCN